MSERPYYYDQINTDQIPASWPVPDPNTMPTEDHIDIMGRYEEMHEILDAEATWPTTTRMLLAREVLRRINTTAHRWVGNYMNQIWEVFTTDKTLDCSEYFLNRSVERTWRLLEEDREARKQFDKRIWENMGPFFATCIFWQWPHVKAFRDPQVPTYFTYVANQWFYRPDVRSSPQKQSEIRLKMQVCQAAWKDWAEAAQAVRDILDPKGPFFKNLLLNASARVLVNGREEQRSGRKLLGDADKRLRDTYKKMRSACAPFGITTESLTKFRQLVAAPTQAASQPPPSLPQMTMEPLAGLPEPSGSGSQGPSTTVPFWTSQLHGYPEQIPSTTQPSSSKQSSSKSSSSKSSSSKSSKSNKGKEKSRK